MKGKVSKETLVIQELKPRDKEELRRDELAEELEDVSVGSLKRNRTVKIGAEAQKPLKEQLRNFLRENTDVFVKSHKDMLRIDTRVAAHYLNIDPEA